jgi:hypothetical protein
MTGGRTEQMGHGVTTVVQAVLRLHSGATMDHPKGRHRRTAEVPEGHRSRAEASMDQTVRPMTAVAPADRLFLDEASMEQGGHHAMAVVRAVRHLHNGATMDHPKGRRETAVVLAGRLFLDEALMEQKGRHAAIVVLVVPHLLSADQTGLMVHSVHLLRTAAPLADPPCALKARRISRISKRRSIDFSEIWKP